jgi:hypothetical protein
MTGTGRHHAGPVVARGIVRSLAVASLLVAFGNAVIVGVLWAALHHIPAVPSAWLWMLMASGVAQLAGGLMALLAFGWAR